jgi:hypothetical protein
MNINLWMVLVAAIASTVLGMLWYSPFLFGGLWLKLSGIKLKKVKKAKDPAGAAVGIWLWLGFMAVATLNQVLWEGKPLKLYILNNAYNLLSLMTMGAILAVWR